MLTVDRCSEAQRREALHRALESRTFSRSEQLRAFLRYVCEAQLDGATDAVSEYLIGVKVLRRPSTYSPAEDSSVRTRAYELRQKLEKLYATELTAEPVHIVIPKGSYIPQFLPAATAPDEPAAVPRQPVKAGRRLWPSWPLLLSLLAGAALGATAMLAFRPGRATESIRSAEADPIVAAAWAPFARNNSSPLLVPATPLYMVLGPPTHSAYKSAIYPAPEAAYPLFREHRPLAPGAKLGMTFSNGSLGVGTMNAVLVASNVLRSLGTRPQILPERPAMLSLLRGRDAVLFGAPVDSQVISNLLERAPLTVDYDENVREFVVRDRYTSEVFYPEKDATGEFRTVYGLISVLNTRDADGARLGTVLFSGVTSVGTHGAAEFFTSPRSLRLLREIFAKEKLAGFPPAYQVVVRCKFESTLLVDSAYQAHRVLARD